MYISDAVQLQLTNLLFHISRPNREKGCYKSGDEINLLGECSELHLRHLPQIGATLPRHW